MIIIVKTLSLILSIFITNKILKKNNWLCSNTGELHQSFTNKNSIPLSGGIFILIGFIFGIEFSSIISYFLIFSVFFIGIFSDLNIIKSPYKRFVLQILIVLLFIIVEKLYINNTRVFFLDHLLTKEIFNYFFVLFCISIMINGNNFIDGLNTLVLGYYTSILLFLYFLSMQEIIYIDQINFTFLLIVFGIVYLFNFFNRLFIGDSGAYIMGFAFSVILIKIFMNNQHVSPFFIILLFWYPCFETLFSILRKLLIGRSPLNPDQNHLHQLLYLTLKKNFKNENYFVNVITANIIMIYNIFIFFIAIQNIFDSQFQIILIIINVTVYSLIYSKLFYLKIKRGV